MFSEHGHTIVSLFLNGYLINSLRYTRADEHYVDFSAPVARFSR